MDQNPQTNEEVTMDEDGGLVIPASAIRKPIEPNPTVRVADGRAFKGSAALNTTNNDLWIWIDDSSMPALFPVFNNPEKTRHIETTYLDTDKPTVYEGYTVMNVIKQDPNGQVAIRLIRG